MKATVNKTGTKNNQNHVQSHVLTVRPTGLDTAFEAARVEAEAREADEERSQEAAKALKEDAATQEAAQEAEAKRIDEEAQEAVRILKENVAAQEAKKIEEAKAIEATRKLSVEQITDKAEKLHLLEVRYQQIKNKKRQVENFAISHDRNNARLTLVDAEGKEITTSNPTSIKKVIEDWKVDLNRCLEETENDMRTEFGIYA